MGKTKGVTTRLIQYLNAHPGEIINLRDLTTELGLSRDQVQQGMYNLRIRRPEFGRLETISAGQQWKFDPNGLPLPPPTPKPITKTKRGNTTPPVLRYMIERPHQVITIDQLIEATGLDRQQIQRVFTNLRTRFKVRGIITVVFGNAWKYDPSIESVEPHLEALERAVPEEANPPEPPAQPEPQRPEGPVMYEKLGTTPKGAVLIRDENGIIYTLAELDF